MNYQVDWNGEGQFENIIPDGYGMHADEKHGGATIENVIDQEAFILMHGKEAIRFMELENTDEDGNPESSYAVVQFFDYAMPDHATLKTFNSPSEAEEYLLAEYPNANYQFDDNYECSGCWSPESGDPDVWFAAIFEQGAEAARCGHGSVNQYEYTSKEWAAKRAA